MLTVGVAWSSCSDVMIRYFDFVVAVTSSHSVLYGTLYIFISGKSITPSVPTKFNLTIKIGNYTSLIAQQG